MGHLLPIVTVPGKRAHVAYFSKSGDATGAKSRL